jgi:hypothetical protein
MDYPMLDGHFSKEDVHSKGKGSFAADYISWAKVAQVVRKHAPGWKCTLVTTEDSKALWAMPDGTCCFVFQWVDPEGNGYDFFPYAITSNNKPVKLEQVSSRVFTDNHRRGFCAAACFQFGAAWQLWAREEIEAAPVEEKVEEQPKSRAKPRKKMAAEPNKEEAEPPSVKPEDLPIQREELTNIITSLSGFRLKEPDAFEAFCHAFRTQFSLPDDASIADKIQTVAHAEFVAEFVS